MNSVKSRRPRQNHPKRLARRQFSEKETWKKILTGKEEPWLNSDGYEKQEGDYAEKI